MTSNSGIKYIMLISDGMADRPLPELDGRTPMQAARKPHMDYVAANGVIGSLRTIPAGMDPGSDVAAMSLLGYDPRQYYTGRGPIEAVSMGISLERKDVAYRCNLVSSDGETMIDYSGGHVSTDEACELMTFVEKRLGSQAIRFYPGISYRHIMVWHDGAWDVKTVPPHNITGQPIEPNMPSGDGENRLKQLIFDSLDVLDKHPINKLRRDNGKPAANMIWPWGQGRALDMPSFFRKTGLTGAVVAAVDLLKGLGKAIGLRVIDVPGVTGYLDTNFIGKAQYALEALKSHDFVLVHVEAPDEAGHIGDIDKKIEAIESIDKLVLGTILDGMKGSDMFRIMVTPDHVTPIAIRTHADDPIPFAMFSSFEPNSTNLPFDERAVPETSLKIEEGYKLIDLLLK